LPLRWRTATIMTRPSTAGKAAANEHQQQPHPANGTAGAAWSARAGDLADWTLARLVNRTDVWGAYTPPERRGQEYVRDDGTKAGVPTSYTAPARKRRGQVTLTRDLLVRHF